MWGAVDAKLRRVIQPFVRRSLGLDVHKAIVLDDLSHSKASVSVARCTSTTKTRPPLRYTTTTGGMIYPRVR